MPFFWLDGGSADGSGPNLYDVLLPAGQDQGKLLAARPVVLPLVGKYDRR